MSNSFPHLGKYFFMPGVKSINDSKIDRRHVATGMHNATHADRVCSIPYNPGSHDSVSADVLTRRNILCQWLNQDKRDSKFEVYVRDQSCNIPSNI